MPVKSLFKRLLNQPEPPAQLVLSLDAPAEDAPLTAYADHLLNQLCSDFPMGYRPQLLWKNRLRVTAGMAYTAEGKIALSSVLLDSREKLERTLKHEYAHLLAVARHGKRATGHGKHWRQAMLDLGEKPEVYHRYPAKRNQSRQRVGYVCDRCGVTVVRKRRLPKRRKYLHARCGGVVKLAWIEQADES